MKAIYRFVFAAGVALGITPAAQAIPITDLDSIEAVISKDDLSAQCNTGSNGNDPDAEQCWANNVLSLLPPDEIVFSGKDENVSVDYETLFNGIEVGVVTLSGDPSYYIVKNANGFALMNNAVDPGRGIFDYMALNAEYERFYPNANRSFNLGNTTVSHVTSFEGGGHTPVPEPAGLALLAAGLLGLGVARRRSSSRARS